MEEDIEQIKSSLEELETERDDIQLKCIKAELELSIENLLTRYKQLEKENKELKANQCDHNISNECLRKSVIRDKIEELEKNENCTYCNNTCNKYLACKCLKELLGEE